MTLRTAVKKRYSRLRLAGRGADLLAVSLLVALTVFAEWGLLRDGTVVGTDAVTQYIPWYSFLGEQLRSGEVPGWNPYQLSGTPFAADPLSGWAYLPAMVFFTLLPLASAVKVYLFFHPLLAGIGAYALARSLRINVAGALFAAVAYEYVGYIYARNTCCFAYVSVLAWLPFAILGAELAIRSRSWPQRGLWWAISGVAISQILAAWLGQGSYYALLALGGYVAYRTLLFPPENVRGFWGRASGLFLHGGAVLVFGFGLAAAGLLPRLEYNALSNLAGGYPNTDFSTGWGITDWEKLFVSPGFFYAGGATLALALAAPLVARGRHAVPYFAFLAVSALTLSGPGFTPVHSLLYLLPNFESLQPHYPQRSMLVFYLAAALLAGAVVSSLGERARRKPYLLALPVLAAVFLVTRSTIGLPIEELEGTEDAGPWEEPLPFLLENGVALLPGPLLVLALVLVLVAAYALIPHRFWILRGFVATLLVLAAFTDLYSAGRATIEDYGEERVVDQITSIDLGAHYAPTDATRLLECRRRSAGPVLRLRPGCTLPAVLQGARVSGARSRRPADRFADTKHPGLQRRPPRPLRRVPRNHEQRVAELPQRKRAPRRPGLSATRPAQRPPHHDPRQPVRRSRGEPRKPGKRVPDRLQRRPGKGARKQRSPAAGLVRPLRAPGETRRDPETPGLR